MRMRKIKEKVYWLGAIDWERRLFDSLIPLPDGTSYNAYLIEGSEKTALLDTVDPPMADELMEQLSDVSRIDYIVSHHAEQDHSGVIPQVLEALNAGWKLTKSLGHKSSREIVLCVKRRFPAALIRVRGLSDRRFRDKASPAEATDRRILLYGLAAVWAFFHPFSREPFFNCVRICFYQ